MALVARHLLNVLPQVRQKLITGREEQAAEGKQTPAGSVALPVEVVGGLLRNCAEDLITHVVLLDTSEENLLENVDAGTCALREVAHEAHDGTEGLGCQLVVLSGCLLVLARHQQHTLRDRVLSEAEGGVKLFGGVGLISHQLLRRCAASESTQEALVIRADAEVKLGELKHSELASGQGLAHLSLQLASSLRKQLVQGRSGLVLLLHRHLDSKGLELRSPPPHLTRQQLVNGLSSGLAEDELDVRGGEGTLAAVRSDTEAPALVKTLVGLQLHNLTKLKSKERLIAHVVLLDHQGVAARLLSLTLGEVEVLFELTCLCAESVGLLVELQEDGALVHSRDLPDLSEVT
eukprot:Colp12_sorted_trinity150504_noHs@22263